MRGMFEDAKRLVYPGLGKCREPQRTPSTNLSIPTFDLLFLYLTYDGKTIEIGYRRDRPSSRTFIEEAKLRTRQHTSAAHLLKVRHPFPSLSSVNCPCIELSLSRYVAQVSILGESDGFHYSDSRRSGITEMIGQLLSVRLLIPG